MRIPSRSVVRRTIEVTLAAACLSGHGFVAMEPAGATTPVTLNDPVALAVANGNLFVANKGANSITELSSTGVLIRVINARADGLAQPRALSVNGTNLFVANATGTITDLNTTTGALIRRITAKVDHLSDPVALLSVHSQLWIADASSSSLTVMNAANGALIKVIANGSVGTSFDHPDALAVTPSRGDVWVTNPTNSTVTEVNAATLAVAHVVSTDVGNLSTPDGITVNGNAVFVANEGSSSVSVLSSTAGALIQNIGNTSLNGGYGFDAPATLLSWGSDVYVTSPPGDSPMVTQIQALSGDSVWMMCNTNYAFHFLAPSALALDGSDLWVANAGNNTLTEMDATTGALVRDVPVAVHLASLHEAGLGRAR